MAKVGRAGQAGRRGVGAHAALVPRARPKLATTVAKETLDAVELFSGTSSVGGTVDILVWEAVRRRLEALYGAQGFADVDQVERSDASIGLWDAVDGQLMKILVREARAFVALAASDQEKRRTELVSAHEVRAAFGKFSSLEDFVRLFVATRPRHAP